MDWRELAGTLIRTGAPLIGTALGGPLGGTIGGVAGKIIADKLGVAPTPEAVDAAIKADPAGASTALAGADAEWQAMAEIAKASAADRTAQSQAINETQRAEVAAGVSWWHWRHLIGYLVILYGLQQILMIWLAALKPNVITPVDVANLFNATTVFTGGLFALLGFVANDTSKLKATAITGEHAPSIVDSVIKKVTGKSPRVIIEKPFGSRD